MSDRCVGKNSETTVVFVVPFGGQWIERNANHAQGVVDVPSAEASEQSARYALRPFSPT